jgi:hypothetical protein
LQAHALHPDGCLVIWPKVLWTSQTPLLAIAGGLLGLQVS